jgi:hypothetical protein
MFFSVAGPGEEKAVEKGGWTVGLPYWDMTEANI